MKQSRKFPASLVLLMELSCSFAQAQVGLSSADQTWLRGAIGSGSFSDLRWPDFSDYRGHVQKFYGLNGYSLWWVKGMEPTSQARQ